MTEDNSPPQINSAQLRVGGGIAGAAFTIGVMLIFLIGIPILRYTFPAAIVLGCVIALVRRFFRHETPGKPWLMAATEDRPEPRDRSDQARTYLLNQSMVRCQAKSAAALL
jgi:hypothetical protein